MISVRVYADEVLFRLDQIPKRFRQILQAKFENILQILVSDLQKTAPGKYLDPVTIQTGISQQGSALVGFIEATDKPGYYLILPSKARVLRFISKSGELVFAKQVLHPFPKGTKIVEQHLVAMKPWIVDQLEDALIEAL